MRRRPPQSPDIVEIRLVGTRGMIDKLLGDMAAPETWAIGRISDFYQQRNGLWAVYVHYKRMPE